MSDPKRYCLYLDGRNVEMKWHEKGNYVRWDDYARLKAEVERLEARIEYVDNLANQYALDDVRSQAHIERLTKAGDAMASYIQFNEEMAKDYNGSTIVHQSVQHWQAAKEGKQP